jgi:hypothetical protein
MKESERTGWCAGHIACMQTSEPLLRVRSLPTSPCQWCQRICSSVWPGVTSQRAGYLWFPSIFLWAACCWGKYRLGGAVVGLELSSAGVLILGEPHTTGTCVDGTSQHGAGLSVW